MWKVMKKDPRYYPLNKLTDRQRREIFEFARGRSREIVREAMRFEYEYDINAAYEALCECYQVKEEEMSNTLKPGVYDVWRVSDGAYMGRSVYRNDWERYDGWQYQFVHGLDECPGLPATFKEATCPRGHYGEWCAHPRHKCSECGEPMDVRDMPDKP